MSDKAITILIGLVLAVFLGSVVVHNMTQEPAPVVKPEQVVPGPSRRPMAKAILTRCQRVNDHVEMSGYVENTGTVELTYVTVQSIWKDANGRVLERGVVYAVDNTSLKVGEKREFTDSTDRPRVAKCNVETLDWWS